MTDKKNVETQETQEPKWYENAMPGYIADQIKVLDAFEVNANPKENVTEAPSIEKKVVSDDALFVGSIMTTRPEYS